jgi:FkbM family methyltransferase
MLAFLPHLLGHSDTAIATIVHIGAGVGTELAAYESLNVGKVVAIEADSTLFKKLQTKEKRYKNVEAIQAWVAESTSECQAHEFSNPRFNSLLAADGLYSHFSNLKTVATNTVSPLAISDVINQHVKANPAQQNILVLEVQGYEVKLLKACALQELHKLDWLIIRSSEDALYEDAVNLSELLEIGLSLGYELVLHDASHTPFIEYYFRLNHCTLNNQEIIEKLKTSKDSELRSQAALEESNARVVKEQEAGKQLKLLAEQSKTKLVKIQDELENAKNKGKEYYDRFVKLEATVALLNSQKQEIEEKLNLSIQQLESNQSDAAVSKKNNQELIKKYEDLVVKFEQKVQQEKELESQMTKHEAVKKQELADANATALKYKQQYEKEVLQVEKITAQSSELQAQIVAMREALTKLTIESEEKIQVLGSQLETEQQKAQELLGQHTKLAASVSLFQEEKQTLERALLAANNLADELKQKAKKTDSDIVLVQKELEQLSKRLDEQTRKSEDAKKYAEGLNGQISELKKQIVERQRSGDLALKMQSKALTDLEDLREKYQTKHHNEQQLVELVKDLRIKLQQAAEFYHFLELNHPELIELEYSEPKNENKKINKSNKSVKKA